MNKILKNLLVVFAAICAIVLVVFCIELIILNREPDSGGNSPQSLSEGNGEGNGEGSGVGNGVGSGKEGGDGESGQQSGSGKASPGSANQTGGGAGPGSANTNPNAAGEPVIPPTASRFSLLMPGGLVLVIYVDEADFEFSEHVDSYRFSYTSGGTAALEVLLASMPRGLDSFAETFLDGYVGSGGSTVGGEGPIGRSAVNGVFVSGEQNGEKHEAWIHSLSYVGLSDFSIVFDIRYRNEEQRDALYAIIGTMSLVPFS